MGRAVAAQGQVGSQYRRQDATQKPGRHAAQDFQPAPRLALFALYPPGAQASG